MKVLEIVKQLSSLLLVILISLAPANAQQKQAPTASSPVRPAQSQQTSPTEQETTFDTLLAAKSYKVYGEVRMIGQLARSNAVTSLLEPARLLGTPPRELTGIVEFLNANAEMLAASRVMFATEPARPSLPQFFVAIELASAQDALKIEPKFRSLVSTLNAKATTAATPPVPAQSGANKTGANKAEANSKQQASPPTPARPVFIKREGSLILTSDTSFTMKSLRPEGSQLLSSDPNFQRARSRFVSEPVFLYYDVNLAPHVVKGSSITVQTPPAASPQAEANKSPTQTVEPIKPTEDPAVSAPPPTSEPDNMPPAVLTADPPAAAPEGKTTDDPAEVGVETDAQGSERSSTQLSMALPMLGALFGGATNYPEAVGVAAAFEGDEVVVRALMVNAPGSPNAIIPFFPSLVSGPEIAPRASSIAPAETDIFVSVSLDLPRIYEQFLKAMQARSKPVDGEELEEGGPPSNAAEAQIAIFEQALGFKIKEDLLGAIGNEVALSMPFSWFKYGPNTGIKSSTESPAAQTPQPGLVVFVSLNDKERVREMLPRVLEVFGFKAPGAVALTEKRGDVEISSYGFASMAFIDDFLIIAPDVAALRAVIDANENHQTLASNPLFKSSTGWQSSRVAGQVYLSTELTEAQASFVQLDDKLQDFMARFNPKPGAITHAALNDDAGHFHELHLPKDWVALMMAGVTSERSLSPMADNELRVIGALMSIRHAQTSYKEGKGSFATRDQLVSEKLVPKEMIEMEGYRIELTATADKYEVTAIPTEYGKTGRQSFYMDESEIIRGADHNGQSATVADKPL